MAAAESLIRLCPSAQLADGGNGLRFEVDLGGRAIPAFAVRYRGRAYAYLNRCAHVAMELDWLPGRFFDDDGTTLLCATHGAAYDPATGDCAGGPCAGRGGLRRLQIVEDGGFVYWRPEVDLRPRGAPAAAG